jgi:hypothetical protein
MTATVLFLGLIFGAVGTVYFIYGKKQHDALFLVTGVALAIYPYFFTNVFVVLIIGAALSMVPVARAKGWI